MYRKFQAISLHTCKIGLLGSEVARRTRRSLGVYVTRRWIEYGVESVDWGVFWFDLRGVGYEGATFLEPYPTC